METTSNKALIDEVVLWATSDLILACPELVEHRTSDWLQFWDHCPVGYLQFITQRVSGRVPQGYALAGMIYERITVTFGDQGMAE